MKRFLLLAGLLLALTACSAPKEAAETIAPTQMPTPMQTAVPSPAAVATPAPTAEQTELPVYPDPITGFFASLHCEGDITIIGGAVKASMQAEAWQAEVEQLYATLRENASPAVKSQWGLDLETLEENYLRFASAEATAEAYLTCSDAFGDEAGNYGTNVNRGRLFSEAEEHARSELLEWHTKNWFEAFSHPNYDPTVEFYRFDPREPMDWLEEQGVPYTVEEYTVEPKWNPWIDGGDNPIDVWTRENLTYDGSTTGMTGDANLETEIWKAELLYTYDCLIALATPNDEEPRKELEEARDALLAFAPDYGICAALYEYSEAFIPELWQEDPEMLYPGSAWRPTSAGAPGTYYRTIVLRLHSLWQWHSAEDLPWRFAPADYEERLAEEAAP